ncbi:MAG: hypothetical protein M1822_005480 [Bathelium mastoideum]|nr:MAG: hypothetical protein M1822_005480 [Bathelium mastoideum]
MVSTVAAATKFQKSDFARNLVYEMILRGSDSAAAPAKTRNNRPFPDHGVLMGVISKVVDSIYLNVVNAGHTLGDLPPELSELCIHLVGAPTFAAIVHKLTRSNGDNLLICEGFQPDLLLWILSHFDGSIRIVLAGTQIFERTAKYGSRSLSVMIETVCTLKQCVKGHSRIQLLELRGEAWTALESAYDEADIKVTTGHRSRLYSSNLGDPSRLLNRDEIYRVRVLVQKLATWMFDVPISSTSQQDIEFSADVSHSSSACELRIGDLFSQWPDIIDDRSEKSDGAMTSMAFILDHLSDTRLSDGTGMAMSTISMFCNCFPAVVDLLKDVSDRCRCRACRNEETRDDYQKECLRRAAIDHLHMMIGHSIADAFGVEDASGLLPLEDYVKEISDLLSRLVRGVVKWDQWFNVAASTALGYSPINAQRSQRPTSDRPRRDIVAVQFGSKVCVAKWLGTKRTMHAHECFTLDIAEGQIPGVLGDCTFFQAAPTGEGHFDTYRARSYSSDGPSIVAA